MTDFTEPQTFDSRSLGFTELQQANYKLWQWLDHITTVWWGPGRRRVVSEEQPDGKLLTRPLPRLEWSDINSHVGTVAAADIGKKLLNRG